MRYFDFEITQTNSDITLTVRSFDNVVKNVRNPRPRVFSAIFEFWQYAVTNTELTEYLNKTLSDHETFVHNRITLFINSLENVTPYAETCVTRKINGVEVSIQDKFINTVLTFAPESMETEILNEFISIKLRETLNTINNQVKF